MGRREMNMLYLIVVSALVLLGCEESARPPQPDSGIIALDSTINMDAASNDGGLVASDLGTDVGVGVFESQNQHIRFKGAARLNGDIAITLAIPPNEVCKEIDLFDCVSFVHPISLGGVEAYVANLYEGSEETTISAPMIVERVGLKACQYRYEQDRVGGVEPHLFPVLELTDDDKRLANVESEQVTESISGFFKVILRRVPTADEIADLKSLYNNIAQHPDAVEPAQEWSVLSCFTLLTSVEYLFY
jgi:hypothetical protein